ncbi:kinase-like domain-containing protein [Aspergillus pseudonomiae]|nr:kinase-like domain-containing protein [Aspergillus pseudonomiae]
MLGSYLEEETLRWYSPDLFYPVKIGDVFRSRYQVVGILGYGGYSTVWLCRDLQQHAYVALRIFEHDSGHGKRETEIYNHLTTLNSSHTGSFLVRSALDDFQLKSADNSYQCLVHIPLAMSLFELRNRTVAKVLPENLLKPTLIHILLALDFLHTEAGIIHTDIQGKNIMLSVEDESILLDFEETERCNPSPCKVIGDRAIYSSRKLGIPKVHGRPVLSDFGEARFRSQVGTRWEDTQPLIYRALEVLSRISWNEKIDIWNLGVLGHLFYARDSEKNNSDTHHLVEMIAVLGPPPKDMLQKSNYAMKFFDIDVKGIGRAPLRSPLIALEKLEDNLQGPQQDLFFCFMR